MRESISGTKNPSYSHGYAIRINGKRIREYHIWVMIRQRVNNPKNWDYKNYGGRGITICKRWSSFKNFLSDMGRAPSEKHSIDRIDNDGNYKPSNCRWATNIEQSNNRRTNIVLTLNGESKTLKQWSWATGLRYTIILDRYTRNWPIEKLFIPKTR